MLWSPPEAPFDATRRGKVDVVRRRLALAAAHERTALATSLQAEDQVLTHLIAEAGLAIEIFALETGRLHPETLAAIASTEACYGVAIERVRPDPAAVAAYVKSDGENGFYDALESRLRCCSIRKVEPLKRALAGRGAWVTGQRREQAQGRASLAFEEHDEAHGLAKFNPLADWSLADVWAVVRAFDIPVNPLATRGYASIGCEPCTRAIRADEDVRAGRWWWESSTSKECGLHVAPAGAPA
jgi:phosphoadenosine phosphosulfate reductase